MAGTTLMLEGRLDRHVVPDLAETLRSVLTGSDSVIRLEAQRVKSVDGCFLQLLLSLSRTLDGIEGRMEWVAPASPLLEAARLLGISKTLKLEDEAK